MTTCSLRFSMSDVDWFARSTGDRNPLHIEESYAQRSPFGGRVVHGVLVALSAIAAVPPRTIGRLRRLVVEFQRPVFPDVGYDVSTDVVDDARYAFRVLDGSMLHLRGMIDLGGGASGAPTPSDLFRAPSAVVEARTWRADELAPGLTLSIPYGAASTDYAALAKRLGLRERGIADWQGLIVLATSYVVGMHLPGKRALFSRLELEFVDGASPHHPLVLDCEVRAFDPRIHMLRIDVRVRSGDAVVANGKLQAFARRPSDPTTAGADRSDALAGKTAVVIGASRGLGASVALALAAHGARVVGTYARSAADAHAVAEAAAGLPGSVELEQGDGRSLQFCDSLRARIGGRGAAVDFLFCNASPPLRPLWIESSAHERLVDYVAESLRLFAAPFTTFLPALTQDTGWVVASSSIAVRAPVAEWPHYVAAKSAIEALVHVAAKERPAIGYLIVRPPALLTEFAPNLGGLHAALPPERVANAIVSRLLRRPARGAVDVVEDF